MLLAFSLLLLNIPLPTFGHAFALVIPVCVAGGSGRLTFRLLLCTAAMASATNDDFLCTFPSITLSRDCCVVPGMLLLSMPLLLIVFSVVADDEAGVVGTLTPEKFFARSLMEFGFSGPESGRGILNLDFFDRSSRTTVVDVTASVPPLGGIPFVVVDDALELFVRSMIASISLSKSSPFEALLAAMTLKVINDVVMES